jgi:two-component system OmpR family response regulator
MAFKILLVEDDQNFGDVLCSYLEMHDYDVTLATDGQKGFDAFQRDVFDMCILDVMMPVKDGFTLAREIRAVNTSVPIVFLTAKAMKEDVVQGLKLGADDYITKPFSSEELLLRIRAILKRTQSGGSDKEDRSEFQIGRYHFNFPLRILSYSQDSGEVDKEKLSPKEAQLLRMFAENANNVLTRTEALNKIWGEDNYFTARSMDVFVTKLRKYLRKDENIEIVNIHGNGFQLLIKNNP